MQNICNVCTNLLAMPGAYEPAKERETPVYARPGAIEIQIQAENFPYLETVRLLEMP
jgi:hypothetical protein